jgi:hypothetical protein
MDQADARLAPEAFGVRSAVGNTVPHGLEDGTVNRPERVSIEDARDPTHDAILQDEPVYYRLKAKFCRRH